MPTGQLRLRCLHGRTPLSRGHDGQRPAAAAPGASGRHCSAGAPARPLAFAPPRPGHGQPSHITANLLRVSTAHPARAWTAPGRRRRPCSRCFSARPGLRPAPAHIACSSRACSPGKLPSLRCAAHRARRQICTAALGRYLVRLAHLLRWLTWPCHFDQLHTK